MTDQGHDMFFGTRAAGQPPEAVGGNPALQISVELVVNVCGKRPALGLTVGYEGGQVTLDDLVTRR